MGNGFLSSRQGAERSDIDSLLYMFEKLGLFTTEHPRTNRKYYTESQ